MKMPPAAGNLERDGVEIHPRLFCTKRSGLLKSILVCFAFWIGCSWKTIRENEKHENTTALGTTYLDTSTHHCQYRTNVLGEYFAHESVLEIDKNRFNLQVFYESKRPETISGRVLRMRDTVALVLDSSSEWGRIPAIESKYLSRDSSLLPMMYWVDGKITNSLIPGCAMDSTHRFFKIK